MKEINEDELKDVTGGDNPNGCIVKTCPAGEIFVTIICRCIESNPGIPGTITL